MTKRRLRSAFGLAASAAVLAAGLAEAPAAMASGAPTDGPAVRSSQVCWHDAEHLATPPDGSVAYIACNDGRLVTVDATGVIDTAMIESGNADLALSRDGRSLSVVGITGNGVGEVQVVRTSDLALLRTITLSHQPSAVAAGPGSSIAVTSVGGTVSLVDTADGTQRSVPGTDGATAVRFTPDGSAVWASVPGTGVIDVIDPASATVTRTVDVGTSPGPVRFSASGATAYVLDADQDISVIDVATGSVSTATLASAAGDASDATSMAVSPDGSTAWVGDQVHGVVGVVDLATATLTSTVPIDRPTLDGVSPDGNQVYVTTTDGTPDNSAVDVLTASNDAVEHSLPLPDVPLSGVLSDSGSRLFVPAGGGVWLSAVSLQSPLSPVLTSSAGDVQLSWQPPLSDAAATYQVQQSLDGGQSWHDFGAATTSQSEDVPAVDAGSAVEYRVTDSLAGGGGDRSAPVDDVGDGTTSQQFSVQTAQGQPVVGGRLTWRAPGVSSGRAASAASNGSVTLPEVVAGRGTVSINGGRLPDGSTVNGSWKVLLGTQPQTLTVPDGPDELRHAAITVTLPNGVPVIGAKVSRQGWAWESEYSARDSQPFYRFVPGWSPKADAVTTNADGVAVIWGYDYGYGEPVQVSASYSDGELRQTATAALHGNRQTIQLKYMPWVTEAQQSASTDAGQVSAVRFQLNSANASRNVAGSTGGVQISLRPPAGWTSKRCRARSRLSGTTDSRGRLILRICGSVSGEVGVESKGAVAAPAIHLRVKGAPPEPPRALRATSPTVGRAVVSWSRSVFAGGARVTSYRISASLPKRKPHVFRVSGGQLRYRLSRLTSGRQWTVSVRAVTRYGVSQPAAATVWVA